MNELDSAILRAWECIGPTLQSDPDELAARLARRRSPLLVRPPRAWCLAVRASDRRLAPRLPVHLPTSSPAHPITLTAQLLREICQPIRIDPPGIKPVELARVMGVDLSAISRLTRRGHLMIERNDSKWYGPRGRCLYTPRLLDPSNFNGRRPPDPLWGSLAPRIVQLIPEDFSHTLKREMAVWHSRPRLCSDSNTAEGGCATRSFPTPERGYRWQCPGCSRLVHIVYYPMRLMSIPEFFNQDLPQLREVDDPQPPPPTFACYRCHRVRYFTRAERDAWNHIVAWASAGLLYGREVERPALFLPERSRSRKVITQTNRPAPRRQLVLDHLLNGWSIRRSAIDLNISVRAVHNHIRALCKKHQVGDRHALAKKLNATKPPPLNQDERARERRATIETLLLAGRSYQQIMEELETDFSTVNRDAMKIYKRHKVSGRRGLARKLGIDLRTNEDARVARLKTQIHRRRASGQTLKQIAADMNLNFWAVHYYLKHPKPLTKRTAP